MNDKSLLKVGVIGTIIAALCCFTPVLVVLFGVVGLSAVFVLITIYAVIRRARKT
jgi:mercuric ion transport protein